MKKLNVNRKFDSKDGFSLVELLVVVVVIGILSALAVPRYLEAVKNAQTSKQKAVIAAIEKAKDQYILQQYRTGNGAITPATFNSSSESSKLAAIGGYLSRNGVAPSGADLLRGTGRSSISFGTLLNTGTSASISTPRTPAAFGG
jgi:prepilin-type N-terminal cleavage/methylation domain-containing protein